MVAIIRGGRRRREVPKESNRQTRTHAGWGVGLKNQVMKPLPFMTTSRRLKRLIVSWELALDFIVTGQHERRYRVIEGVPQDAALVNVRHEWPNCIELLLVSAEFEEVNEGAEIPILNPIVELLSEIFVA